MLTQDDLKQISLLLLPIAKDVKSMKKDIKKIKSDLNMVIDNFDKKHINVVYHVERIEKHLGFEDIPSRPMW